jgi:prefoldin subunit 5
MDFDQFGGIIAPIATIIAASSWLHGSLNKIATRVEVMNAKLDDYGQRISRIEHELDQLRRQHP